MYKIGVTGGIGSGKTTAADFFITKGAFVFNADKEFKSHLKHTISLQHKLIKAFGSKVSNKGKLELSNLAEVAFSNKLDQEILNGIAWPEIMILIDHAIDRAINENYKLFIVDAALIFEANFQSILDSVLLITADKDIRIQRAKKRHNIPLDQIQKRMMLQLNEKKKRSLADYTINNNGNKDKLYANLEKFYISLFL